MNDQKVQALSAWRKLLEEPEIWTDAEEHYDEPLKLADGYSVPARLTLMTTAIERGDDVVRC
jgi:hypothetical protein